ncbi:alpha/beta hydrolase [Micromonospora sp. DR5-3]|uniref:alpha/beta fold hydrolase n=1 Tax=unclassified Micromonospora TaxID=2617518 RepID=UPI0011D782DB|nr:MULTISPECIES: alpha/beta hydrolase [unclassified Micromonospora]MCW3815653.1 alpha/beta hydrolase [Micromonospora sp. DR5-3]TYC23817.1 alpha/beta hydrolase [Micromonospora sp. MP36]
MRAATVGPDGAQMRWVEIAGEEPARVYVHGLGAMSTAYFVPVATRPGLAGHRSLFVDLFGFGLSDRPATFGYTLEDHATALAATLDRAGVREADVVAHSMGAAVAIVLAHRRPDLVGRLLLVEANLDPYPRRTVGSSGVAGYAEADFLAGGYAETLDRVGPLWASTMRFADPVGLHRTATGLAAGTRPTMRRLLERLPMPRTFVQGGLSDPVTDAAGLSTAGVTVVTVPGAGHNVMLDAPDEFTRVAAAALAVA